MPDLFADVNGIKICYEIHGKEEFYPLILVHGYGGKKSEWKAQAKALSKKYKVITLDLRGAGKSDRPNMPYTMKMYSDDIKSLLEFLKIEKTHIAGFSLGGMVVQHFVLNYPEIVNKIILINTNPGFHNKEALNLFVKGKIERYNIRIKDPVKAFQHGARYYFSRKFWRMMEEDPKRKFYGIFSAEDLIKDSAEDISTPQDIINGAHAIAEHYTHDLLYKITHKTLILCAEKDRLSPILVNKKLHELLPNSILKVIKEAGHSSIFEKAPEVNQIILEFLES
ncbi:MAG: alpha/beta fold hydrolase [Candidatus Heimdallarchaeota archaeon]